MPRDAVGAYFALPVCTGSVRVGGGEVRFTAPKDDDDDDDRGRSNNGVTCSRCRQQSEAAHFIFSGKDFRPQYPLGSEI